MTPPITVLVTGPCCRLPAHTILTSLLSVGPAWQALLLVIVAGIGIATSTEGAGEGLQGLHGEVWVVGLCVQSPKPPQAQGFGPCWRAAGAPIVLGGLREARSKDAFSACMSRL